MFRGERVTFAGQSWDLRGVSAYTWVGAVLHDPVSLAEVVPGLLRARDTDRLYEAWTEYPDLDERCTRAARKVLGRVAGREWYRAVNLIEMIAESWTHFNGSLLLKGCDARKMELSSWLDAAYILLIRNQDDGELKKIEFRLSKTPKGVKPKASDVKAQMAAFAAD